MTTYYLPRELSDYVDEQGGRDFLAGLVEKSREVPDTAANAAKETPDAASPFRFCQNCGMKLQHPGADICFECGSRQVAR